MPSGYTHKIIDPETYPNFTPKDFILDCAKGFSGFISDEEIRRHKSNLEYNEKALEKAKTKLKELKSKFTSEWLEEIVYSNNSIQESYNRSIEINKLRKQQYDAFIEAVESWGIPSDEHENLKNFCMKQLTESKEWDTYVPNEPSLIDINDTDAVNNYISETISYAERDILYHEERIENENKLHNGHLEWHNKLLKSLEEVR
jgi:hypothetical protein